MASSSLSHTRSFSDFERETPAVSRKKYDAFINHRGPDVKETVAFALYDSLEEKGFCAFLDDQELQLGDSAVSAIKDAIYSSSVQIAIFSPRYAESSWCLDELVDMLKTREAPFNALFIPVLCDVDYNDLRDPDRGVYKTAFEQHARNVSISNDTIDRWKAALHSSSLISFEEFRGFDGDIEMLRTTIALAVQRKVGKTCLHAGAAVSTSTSAQVKKSCLLPGDSHPVGIEPKVEHMVGLLEDQIVKVIAVVGMGGSGKTFLLQNVYKAVKSNYDCSIWLSISKSYSVKNLQHDIASHIDLKIKSVTEERAAELIHGRLQGKKSLIVLDDLWNLSTENSLIDKLGLSGDIDSKFVVTTRNRHVAENSRAHIYDMENLSDDDSWRLFCFYAFPNRVGNRGPPDMEEEGRKIVKQCGKLPLAIKTIAASLANTRDLSKWEFNRLQLEGVLTPVGDLDPVMKILKLSYDSLPANLKLCFAYLSFFPEDEVIDPEYLIYLWIGEGFIPAVKYQWNMAWDCLDQLAQLCLIQVCEINEANGVVKFCKIHDLLHDLAI